MLYVFCLYVCVPPTATHRVQKMLNPLELELDAMGTGHQTQVPCKTQLVFLTTEPSLQLLISNAFLCEIYIYLEKKGLPIKLKTS